MNPVTLNPELTFAAIGALLGALIATGSQALTAFLQRNSDRVLKTYETRLQIFTDWFMSYDALVEAKTWITDYRADPAYRAMTARNAQLRELLARWRQAVEGLTAEPAPSAERRAQLEKEYEASVDAMAEVVAEKPGSAPDRGSDLRARSDRVDELRREFDAAFFKLRVVSGSSKIDDVMKQMVEGLEDGKGLTPDAYAALVDLAAEHVGIRLV